MAKLIMCWAIGKKVLSTTHCKAHRKKCGEVPGCYFKTSTAKIEYINHQKDIEKDKTGRTADYVRPDRDFY